MGSAANPFSNPRGREEFLRDQADEQNRKAVEATDPNEARRLSNVAKEARRNSAALDQQLSDAGA